MQYRPQIILILIGHLMIISVMRPHRWVICIQWKWFPNSHRATHQGSGKCLGVHGPLHDDDIHGDCFMVTATSVSGLGYLGVFFDVDTAPLSKWITVLLLVNQLIYMSAQGIGG